MTVRLAGRVGFGFLIALALALGIQGRLVADSLDSLTGGYPRLAGFTVVVISSDTHDWGTATSDVEEISFSSLPNSTYFVWDGNTGESGNFSAGWNTVGSTVSGTMEIDGAIWDTGTWDYLQKGSVTFNPGTLLTGNVVQHEYVALTNLDYLLVDLSGGNLQSFFPPEAVVVLDGVRGKLDVYGVPEPGTVPEPGALTAWSFLAPLGAVSLVVGWRRRRRGSRATAPQ
jgi:hypothetical protein